MRYASFMSSYSKYHPERYAPARNVRPINADPSTGEGKVNILAEEITKKRAQGMTWAQIEAETGISAAECATIASRYLRSSYTGTSITDARQLQIMRLEMLMQMLYQQVEDGDLLSQGRQTTNLIATINQVTELLDLKKDRLKDEQIRLSQEQGGLILHILEVVKLQIIETVLQAITDASIYNTGTGRREIQDAGALRALIERDWSGWFASAADQALLAASSDSNDSTASVPNRTIRGELR